MCFTQTDTHKEKKKDKETDRQLDSQTARQTKCKHRREETIDVFISSIPNIIVFRKRALKEPYNSWLFCANKPAT
jgi:hypothetical protein